MTKDEAISKMNLGIKMTHTSFADNEFITIIDNMIVDENNYHFDINDFFSYRTNKAFDTGWSEFR